MNLVLCSGGLDSTTVLTQVKKYAGRDNDSIRAIAFQYGQRHSDELLAAAAVCDYFDIPLEFIRVPMFTADSVLMRHDSEMPHLSYEELEKSVGVSPTYVPFRNGTFLAIASGYALHHGCDTIHMGVHAEDARGWAYPDCSPEFVGAMANAIYVGTYHKVRLLAPLQYLLKKDVVKLGLELGAPFHLTHSCYEGSPACGRCPTCVSRLEAFKENHVRDPIQYEFDQYGSLKDAALVEASLKLKNMLEEE